MSVNTDARSVFYEAPDLLTLGGRPLINIVSYLDSSSLQQLRLTCHLLKQYVDETITTFTLGTVREYNRIEDFQYEITRAARLWPSIKKITVYRFRTPRDYADMPEYMDAAIRRFSETAWTDVEFFDCSRCWHIGPSSGIALAACSHRWRNLRSLLLKYTGIKKEFIQNLTSGDYPALEVLELGNNFLQGAGNELANLAKICPNLKELGLARNDLTGETLNTLCKVELLKLESINLMGNGLNRNPEDESINLGQARWPNLRNLILGSNRFRDSEWQSIAQGNWPFLEHLKIVDEDIGIDGAKALRDAACGPIPRWPRLTSLTLERCFQETNSAFEVLMKGDWRALQSLQLDDDRFGTEEALVLAAAVAAGRLGALTSLSLTEDTGFSEEYFAALLSVPWKGLVELNVGGTTHHSMNFPKRVAQELVAAVQKNHLPNLKTLGLSNLKRPICFAEIFPPNTWLTLENLHLTDSCIYLEEVVGLSAVAEHLPKLLELILTYGEWYVEGEPRRVPYGGLEGFKILFNAPWKSLKKFEFNKPALLSEDDARKWMVTGKYEKTVYGDEKVRFVVERIEG